MILALSSILIAIFLGSGAVKELVIRGVQGGEVQPFFVGLIGSAVSVLMVSFGVALWRKHPAAHSLALPTALASLAFHVCAALPPHRNVGLLALLVGAGYGLILLGVILSSRGGVKAPLA